MLIGFTTFSLFGEKAFVVKDEATITIGDFSSFPFSSRCKIDQWLNVKLFKKALDLNLL